MPVGLGVIRGVGGDGGGGVLGVLVLGLAVGVGGGGAVVLRLLGDRACGSEGVCSRISAGGSGWWMRVGGGCEVWQMWSGCAANAVWSLPSEK